jgi:ABC-type transporter Mla MlaB component
MSSGAATVERSGRTAIVRIRGDVIVPTARLLYGTLRTLYRRRDVRKIVIDFTGVGRLDSAGVAVFESQQLIERANAIVGKADTIVGNLAQVTEPEGLAEIVVQTRATATNLAQATASLRSLVAENREGLRASIAAVETAAKRAADLVDNGQVKAALSDLRQASRSFKELAREVRQRPSRLLYSSPPAERKLP